MAQLAVPERPAALFARLFSYYRYSFPAAFGTALPTLVAAGFEKKFGQHVLVCTFCRFSTDCSISLPTIDKLHYDHSPQCRSLRLDDSPLNHILQQLQVDLSAGLSTSQFLFEDDFLRLCSADPDFRELTFAFGQWGFASRLSASVLAQNGFYYAVKKHSARCLACLLTLDSPNLTNSLQEWHRQQSPHCRFVARAAVEMWEPLCFPHDITGHLQDEEVEVVHQSSAALSRPRKRTFPDHQPAVAARSSGSSREKASVSSLSSLFQALNSVGLSDDEIRTAIKQDTALLNCTSSSEFMAGLSKASTSHASTESETTLRAGNMSTIDNFKCALCVNDLKNTAFLPCGHVYTCHTCALRVEYGDTAADRRCCVCRSDVIGIYPLLFTHAITEY